MVAIVVGLWRGGFVLSDSSDELDPEVEDFEGVNPWDEPEHD
jgi:hypothetical protein